MNTKCEIENFYLSMLETTSTLYRQSTHSDSPEYAVQRYNLQRQNPLKRVFLVQCPKQKMKVYWYAASKY